MGEQTEIIEKVTKSNEVLMMFLRKVFTLASGYLVGNGLIDGDAITTPMIDTLAGGVCIIISLFWSRKAQKKLKGENEK